MATKFRDTEQKRARCEADGSFCRRDVEKRPTTRAAESIDVTDSLRDGTRRLKVIEDVADIVPAPKLPDFTSAPTRNRRSGWTAERQRTFIERVALTGNIGDACVTVGLSSTSFYNLCRRPGAESFAKACDAARVLAAASRGAAIAWDRAINGRVERFYKDGELVLERRIPSDYLLTWLLARLDPLTFGSPAAKAQALAAGDPRDKARKDLPQLMASFEDVPEEECPTEHIDYLDDRLGEAGSGDPVSDQERG